jgi:hypothetical protein
LVQIYQVLKLCVSFVAGACKQKLYKTDSAIEKTRSTGGVESRAVYKNLETSSSIYDNSGNFGEKRPHNRCRALRPDQGEPWRSRILRPKRDLDETGNTMQSIRLHSHKRKGKG